MKTQDGDTSTDELPIGFFSWTSSLCLLLKLSLPEMEMGSLLSEIMDQKAWASHVLSHFIYFFIF